MSVARTFVRLAFSSLIVGALAAACTVKEADDDDSKCNAGDSRVCECDNGETGSQKCNAKETGYGSCSCPTGSGGSANGGDGPTPTAGSSGSSYGGTSGSGGSSYAGEDAGGMDAGGAGGAPTDVTPAVCMEDPNDDCANCYQPFCCEEWVACTNDEIAGDDNDCAEQFFAILECVDDKRADADATPTNLNDCAEEEDGKNGAWSANLRPQLKPMLDCVAGGMGWASKAAFTSDACKVSCFDKL